MNVDGSHNTITVNTLSIHEAGQKITQDAQALQTTMMNTWGAYNSETGRLSARCLQQDFDALRTQLEPLTSKAIENRIKIGQTLAKSATLWDFQETVTAQGFDGPNIYHENPYAATDLPGTNLGNQQRPDGFSSR